MQLVNIQNVSGFRQTKTVFVDNFFCLRHDDVLSLDVVPHLGLMTLASVLQSGGHIAEILDPKVFFVRGKFGAPDHHFIRASAQELLNRRADVIGFTAYGLSLPYVIRVAAEIKRIDPMQKIALGGPHATIMGEKILRAFPYFDAIVRYEAERIIQELVTTLAEDGDLSKINNLVFGRGGEILRTQLDNGLLQIDEIPNPALDLYPVEELGLSELSIEAGRGCPFECTFCSTANFFKRRYRMKSNRRMLEEMESARARYGIRTFNLNHDLFGLVKPNLREFCEMARGRGFQWKCSMRPDTLDPAMLNALANAGCIHIYFGIETGSPKLQQMIRKSLDLERTRNVVEETVRRGIHCTTSFITGFPEETPEDQDLTIDFLGTLLRIDPQRIHPQLHILSPEPGSALAENSPRTYFDGVGPEAGEPLDEELIRVHPEIFSVFYHYDGELPRQRAMLASIFITNIMPVLGYPLTTHIVANFFSGRLTRMFHRMIPKEKLESAGFESALHDLWNGLELLVRWLSPQASYLEDLVRLSRILMLRKMAGRPSNHAWMTHFNCDVRAVADAIVNNPEAEVLKSVRRAGEKWCLIHCKSETEAVIGEIPAHLAGDLRQQSQVFEIGGRLGREMRELEVSSLGL
jgi:radical SAM superfamily enzyme YgiQ (UPF0313 family)